MVKRLTAMLIVVPLLAIAAPSIALAATVGASCNTYDGGIFTTHGTADNWQDHTHDGWTVHIYYYGRATKYVGWGVEYGAQSATVTGPNLSGQGATCPPQ